MVAPLQLVVRGATNPASGSNRQPASEGSRTIVLPLLAFTCAPSVSDGSSDSRSDVLRFFLLIAASIALSAFSVSRLLGLRCRRFAADWRPL